MTDEHTTAPLARDRRVGRRRGRSVGRVPASGRAASDGPRAAGAVLTVPVTVPVAVPVVTRG